MRKVKLYIRTNFTTHFFLLIFTFIRVWSNKRSKDPSSPLPLSCFFMFIVPAFQLEYYDLRYNCQEIFHCGNNDDNDGWLMKSTPYFQLEPMSGILILFTLESGFKPAENVRLGFFEWTHAVVTASAAWHNNFHGDRMFLNFQDHNMCLAVVLLVRHKSSLIHFSDFSKTETVKAFKNVSNSYLLFWRFDKLL